MAFTKVGAIFPIAQVHLTSPEQWQNFKKKASIGTAVVEEGIKTAEEKQAVDKNADFQIIADIDTNRFVYIHTTIMAGVKTAGADFWVTPETEKYINDNHDAWKCDDLLKDYHTFRRATTFVEHDQNIERAKGKCIDAIARKLPDTVLIDVLFSVDKRHDDLVNNITAGIINSVSMGCTTEKTICTVCGNAAPDSDKYCSHIKNGKGQSFICKDGSKRKAAELCINNTFFDVSLVANPAFAGAIFRKILSSSQASSHLLANILTTKIEAINNSDVFLKAASKDSEVVVKADGTVQVKEANYVPKIGDSIKVERHSGIFENAKITGIKDNMIAYETSKGDSGTLPIDDERLSFKESAKKEGILTKEDMKTMLASFIKEEKSATNFLSKIVKKFFGKDASHPIENISSDTNFDVGYNNYEGIDKDYKGKLNTLPDFLEQDKEAGFELNKVTKSTPIKEDKLYQNFKRSHVERFTCHKCGHTTDLWRIKAASIDLGFKDVLKCPECSFLVEASVMQIVKKATITSTDKLQLKDLGFNDIDIRKLSSEQAEIIIMNSVSKDDFAKDPNAFLRKSYFVANQEIPLRIEDNNLIFDKAGEAVIAKGERLQFVAAKNNVGAFRTELGEIAYLPVKKTLF